MLISRSVAQSIDVPDCEVISESKPPTFRSVSNPDGEINLNCFNLGRTIPSLRRNLANQVDVAHSPTQLRLIGKNLLEHLDSNGYKIRGLGWLSPTKSSGKSAVRSTIYFQIIFNQSNRLYRWLICN